MRARATHASRPPLADAVDLDGVTVGLAQHLHERDQLVVRVVGVPSPLRGQMAAWRVGAIARSSEVRHQRHQRDHKNAPHGVCPDWIAGAAPAVFGARAISVRRREIGANASGANANVAGDCASSYTQRISRGTAVTYDAAIALAAPAYEAVSPAAARVSSPAAASV